MLILANHTFQNWLQHWPQVYPHLAHMINSSRQTVSELLRELKQREVISTRYGEITILKIQKLEAISDI